VVTCGFRSGGDWRVCRRIASKVVIPGRAIARGREPIRVASAARRNSFLRCGLTIVKVREPLPPSYTALTGHTHRYCKIVAPRLCICQGMRNFAPVRMQSEAE